MSSDVFHAVRKVQFGGRATWLVCNAEGSNGSLVAIANFLLLTGTSPPTFSKGADGSQRVSKFRLSKFVRSPLEKFLKEQVTDCNISEKEADVLSKRFENLVSNIEHGVEYDPCFESTSEFKCTNTWKSFFPLINSVVYHGLVPDPEDINTCRLVEGMSFLQLMQRRHDLSQPLPCRLPQNDPQVEHVMYRALGAQRQENDQQLELIDRFLRNRYNNITPSGFRCLLEDVPEDRLSFLWRGYDITVLYKHAGVLHILHPDEELADGQRCHDVMWESIEDADGNWNYFSSTFNPVNLQESQEIEKQLIEDGEKSKVPQELAKDEEKSKVKKKTRRKKKGTMSASDDAKVQQDSPEKATATAENRTDSSAVDEATGTIMRKRFIDFLSCFTKQGCKKSYFMGQVKALKYYEHCNLEVDYSLIREYDEDLALRVEAEYDRACEDLKQGLRDYLHFAMIEVEKESMTEEEKEVLKDRINTTATLTISNRPERKSVQSFGQFVSLNKLWLVFVFEGQSFDSTSYVGRQMGKGYLKFILKKHRSGWSWNGEFDELHMFVIVVSGELNFVITSQAKYEFNSDRGTADTTKYCQILFPHYKGSEEAKIPSYLDKLQTDCMTMPNFDPNNPEPFNNFQDKIGEHMAWKAPLVRAAFICNLFSVCRSLVIHFNPVTKGAYEPLDNTDGLAAWVDLITDFCKALADVYHFEASSPLDSRYNRHTYWCALWFGRSSIQHLFDHTKVDGKQLIEDAVIADLILEHYLEGLLSDVVNKIKEVTGNFSEHFSSTWRTYIASETFDDFKNLVSVTGTAAASAADKASNFATVIYALESLGHSASDINAALSALGYSQDVLLSTGSTVATSPPNTQ